MLPGSARKLFGVVARSALLVPVTSTAGGVPHVTATHDANACAKSGGMLARSVSSGGVTAIAISSESRTNQRSGSPVLSVR